MLSAHAYKSFCSICTVVLLFTVKSFGTWAQEPYPCLDFPYSFPMELPVPDNDTLEICVLGDVMMHTMQIQNAHQGNGAYDFRSYFKYIEKDIRKADIAIANMEFTLGGEPYSGYPCFSAPDSLARYLAECGIDVFLTANNHIYDTGRHGAERTLKIYGELGKEYGIRVTGLAENSDVMAETFPLKIKCNGVELAIVNLTYGTNLGIDSNWPKVYRLSDRQRVEAAMAEARKCAATLVLPHWGDEYVLTHNSRQEENARWLVSQGADMIIGAHPHVIQDCQEIDGVTVAYSLGNAVSNMSAANTQLGLMATLRIVRYHNGMTKVMKPEFKYIWCSRPGGYGNTYTVVPVSEFIGTRADWMGGWEYDKMVSTYRYVKDKTRITE